MPTTRILLASLLATSCAASIEGGDDGCDDPPAPAIEIQVPDDCWTDARCAATREELAACGRPYMCRAADGKHDVCVVASDCDCLEQWEGACGEEVELPGFCEL